MLVVGAKLSVVLLGLGFALFFGRAKSASWNCTVLRVGFWVVALLPVLSFSGPRWEWQVLPKPVGPIILINDSVAHAATSPWISISLVAWLAGAVISLTRLAYGLLRLRIVISRSVALQGDHAWPVLISGDVTSPCTVGCVRPAVLLPLDSVEWTDERRNAVLEHEFAHIRRHDWIQIIAVRTIKALFWPNLLLHWIDRMAEVTAEQACDDEVLRRGVSGHEYAKHLVSLARAPRVQSFPTAAMAAPCALEVRVRGVLRTSTDRARTGRRSLLRASSMGVLALIGIGSVQLVGPRVQLIMLNGPIQVPGKKVFIKSLNLGSWNPRSDTMRPAETLRFFRIWRPRT